MKEILVSICIPTFNRSEQVEKCVKDCLKIDGEFFEIVVVDDCSNDDTQDRIRAIRDSRVRYIKNEKNMGFPNMARALMEGKGEYCLLLGDKDVLHCLDWDNLIQTIQRNENVSIYHWKYYGKNRRIIRNVTKANQNKLQKASFEALLHAKYHFAESAAFMYRRDDIIKVWDSIDKSMLIWKFYPQVVLAILLATCGDSVYLKDMRTVCREEERRIHYKQTYGDTKYPYWHIDSRSIQNKEWISFLYSLDLNEKTRRHMIHTICVESIKQFASYYLLINNKESGDNPLLIEAEEIIKKDRKQKLKTIYDKMFKRETVILEYAKIVGDWKNKYLGLELEYCIRRSEMKRKTKRTIKAIK